MNNLKYWLILNQCPGIGPRTFFQLLEHCNSVKDIVDAPIKQLHQWNLADKTIAFLQNYSETLVEKDLLWAEQDGCHILTFSDEDYPPLLREISDPPPIIYIQGNLSVLKKPQIAMVGSRNPTAQGKENAYKFSRALANAGLIITSGMALGIDGVSHQGALSVNKPTIAVTGTGLDRVYPARHKQLAHEISLHGAIISEYAIGTGVKPGHFPRRNRIISGLSLGVVVIEAATKSGSLISARLAMEQGREVFAIPGSIHNTLARGCHSLIKQGAKLVETANDIIEELSAMAQFVEQTPSKQTQPDSSLHQINALGIEEKAILAAIDFDTTSFDQIKDRTEFTTELVSGTLLILELEGLINSAAGGYCKRSN